MKKEQLFNCCTNNNEPDWSQFTHLTIVAMADYDGRSEIAESGTDTNFWCIFGVDKDGIFIPITDCTTELMAMACAEILSDISGLALKSK